MQKLSELISKNVFSLSSGTRVGYVLNVALSGDHLSVENLVVVDDESEQEAVCDFKGAIFANDAVFIASERQLRYLDVVTSEAIIGKQVFSIKGDNLGKIQEILIKNCKIEAILTDFSVFSPKLISIFGRDALIVGGKKKAIEKEEEGAKFMAPNLERLVSVSAAETPKDVAVSPYRISSDPNSLIGKMATRDIVGLNNELIIKKFEIISAKKISEAKKHNKLNLLFYNCK